MFGWECDSWERCGDVVEGEPLVGTTTVGGCGVLQLLGGPGEGVDAGEVRIPIAIPVNAGRKCRGGS